MTRQILERLINPLDQLLSNLRNRHFLALDVLLFCLTAVLALWLRIERVNQMGRYTESLALYVLVAIGVRLVIFIAMGIYSYYWRQASIDELAMITLAVGAATALTNIIFFAILRPFNWISDDFPRSIPLLDGFLVLIAVGGTRYSVRLVERTRQHFQPHAPTDTRVVIVGAGKAGAMIVREMQANPQLGLFPVAFVDSDRQKHGMRIQGVPVVGGHDQLETIVRDFKAQQVIIAMPTAPGKMIRELTQVCHTIPIPVRTVPGMYEILDGSVTINQLRPVEIADLLRREPIQIEMERVVNLLRGKRVMVTGAGGSIGSELCRQIARCSPASLILLGHGEYSIYTIANELRQTFRFLELRRVIADVRDADRLKMIFARYHPQIVFHAAAHKHVTLMEENIEDAVTTNVLGTRTLLHVAAANGVSHFVFISTDKAVKPTSVMGATKRIAEMLVHETAEETGRCFVSVRFGNVLDSRGSVVPLFKQQIARGGPITITHPEARRYFMTIPESVQLVLQAATLGKGGETFVLDMGEPIKIVDLARDLIRLSGLEEGKDIEITFTGLGPGEKLFEELFLSDELYHRTNHSKIFVARNGTSPAPTSLLTEKTDRLIAAARRDDPSTTRRLLGELVPEFCDAPVVESVTPPRTTPVSVS
jgi:FlaA1/EpsC-like NDP-sugar epimerase